MYTAKKITSLQSPRVKRLAQLRESRQTREDLGTVLVMGQVVIKELCRYLSPICVYVEENQMPPAFDCEVYTVTASILKKVTALASPPTMIAEFPKPDPLSLHSLETKNFIVACDRVADPGNLGTIIRSARSFGWEGLFLFDNGVDIFNDKVLRASRGAALLTPYYRGTFEELSQLPHPIFIADTTGTAISCVPKQQRAILILGNEAQGVNQEAKKRGTRVTIAMQNEMESLNVAIAASIIMYELRK